MWGGMENAPTFDRGSYFQPGFQGQVELIRCFPKETQNSGLQFLAECRVKTSNMQAHPVGSQATWFQSMRDVKVYLPACKMFVYAVLDIVDDMQARTTIDPHMVSIMNWVSGTPNGFGGYLVGLSTVQVPKKDKNPFTRHDWAQINYKASGRKGPDIQAVIQAALPYAQVIPVPQRSGAPQGPGGGMFGGMAPPAPAPGAWAPPAGPTMPPLVNGPLPPWNAPPAAAYAPPPAPGFAYSNAPAQAPGYGQAPPPQAPVQVSPDGHWKIDPATNTWVPNR